MTYLCGPKIETTEIKNVLLALQDRPRNLTQYLTEKDTFDVVHPSFYSVKLGERTRSKKFGNGAEWNWLIAGESRTITYNGPVMGTGELFKSLWFESIWTFVLNNFWLIAALPVCAFLSHFESVEFHQMFTEWSNKTPQYTTVDAIFNFPRSKSEPKPVEINIFFFRLCIDGFARHG